jgi:hypothetical protein
MPMPWKHGWHSWLTRHWDEDDWNGWEGNLLRWSYVTLALLATLFVAPSLLSVFLYSFTVGILVAVVVFGVYSWLIVGHYPEPAPED